jgi:hypothetical protein
MGHAKIGYKIKILDNNSGHWVKVGNIYIVKNVDATDIDSERVYVLEGVDISWYAEPQHFEILDKEVALTHPRYDTFQTGNTVRRWRDVEEEEWIDIGEVDLPELGEDVEVLDTDLYNDYKEDSFYSEPYGWIPMKAFVLAEYYNNTITNRGTAALNTTDHGKSKSTGISIEVQRSSPSISTGQRTSRGGVQGRGNATVTRGRYSSHQAITGR